MVKINSFNRIVYQVKQNADVPLQIMKKIILLFLPFILFSCKKREILTAREIQSVINRFDEGWRIKDSSIVDSVLSGNYIYFTQSGSTYDRKNVVHTAASDEYKLLENKREQISFRIEGNTAIVNTVWIGKGSYRGIPFADTQRCSITIIKQDGRVQILSEHCTLIN
jgi:hypothetical protein